MRELKPSKPAEADSKKKKKKGKAGKGGWPRPLLGVCGSHLWAM